MTLFKRTGGEDFPDRIKCMISGPPKSGKTSFLGTVPNIVIADTEPHANNLQSVAHKNLPYVTIEGTEDLHRLLFVLKDEAMRKKAAESLGLPDIEAVAIDTLDTLQQIMKAERLKETRQTQFLRDDWAWIKDEMVQILRAFTSLPLHVFFIVHTKTQEIGKGDDVRTRVLPGLQGSIAEEIAGMVGYSLLAFRKQEIRPDGSAYTKYWLRAEGDETYDFLGNRAAGRLPDIVEPTFADLYEAAIQGRKAVKDVQAPVENVEIQISGVDVEKVHEIIAEEVAQTSGQASPTSKASDDEPVNATALSHIKKVYDALGVTFPQELVLTKTMGEARTVVRMWQAIQADHAAGKDQEDPKEQMLSLLLEMGWRKDEADAKPAEPEVVADPNGTIEQVLAYAGDDLTLIQEAYDAELDRVKPRQTLLNALTNKGAKTAPKPVEAVTPEVEDADANEAEALVAESLGGEILTVEVDGDTAPCEECGGAINDHDLAVLGKARFGRWLCVDDYIAETKKARASA